ncbi:hypothetical protein HW555_003456 [Spodoptera exigua]|uniref:Uncharacterized protein n=1 Tax=Spodoptera exigua TaxID=7107 RepID=A0A835GNA9_SPOEX|nr:hypothetical protein HW555_003456 [Spodoptera exigua]
MMQASSSSERTPLVQPTYVFESSLARRYQKRLHHMQCVMCVFIIAILMVALLVTVSYNLSQDTDDDITTEPSEPALPIPGNLTLLKMSPGMVSSGNLTAANGTLMAVPPALQPLLDLKWPLKEQPPAAWANEAPSKAQIASALLEGKAALKEKRRQNGCVGHWTWTHQQIGLKEPQQLQLMSSL